MEMNEGTSMIQTSRSFRLRLPYRGLLATGAALLLIAGLVAYGGSSKASANGPGSIVPLPSGSRGPGAGRGGAAPTAYGMAAAIAGNSVEVQDPATGQVTVTFGSNTGFSQTKSATMAALAVGDCVTAIGQRSGSASPAASGSAGANRPSSFTAASVSIEPAVNGSCTAGGFGGGGGGFTRPSGSPRPSGSFSRGAGGGGFGGGGFGGLANGKVSQLSGDTMSVLVTGRGGQSDTTDQVTLTASTTYTQTVTVSSTALKVGECVTAIGSTGSTGSVSATRITLSTPGANGCTTGFGRRPQAGSSSTGA
jgi:hypothetical protein